MTVVSNSFTLHAKPKNVTSYVLMPSVSTIKCDKSNNVSPASFTCSVQKVTGDTVTTATDGTLCYRLNNDITIATDGTQINIGGTVSGYSFSYSYITLAYFDANGTLRDKKRIPIVKDGKDGDGDDGDDAVTYQIVFTEAWARVDNSNIITARLRGYVYKIEGTTRTPLNGATIRYGYILTNSSTYADTTADASGYFTEDNWFNGDVYGDSGYVQGSKTVFAAIIINNEVMCVEHVMLVKDAAPGQTGSAGKMCYIAGTYDPLQTYTSNASETVAVEVENSNGEVELYILDAATNVVNGVHISPTDGRTDIWHQGLNNYNLIRAKYLFTDFASLGSFIVSQDFFMSQYGTLVGFGGAIQVTNARTAGKVYMKTVNGKRTPYYACGSSSSGDKPCYLFFDAKDPMAEDVKNGPTFTLEGKGVDDAVIVRRVWFLASEATTVEITLTPSSEANWDFGAVGALDTTVLSASGVTAETVKDGTTPTLLKASGTTALVQTVNVTAGLHFFEIAYLKDSSENQNNDKATFIFAEASNNGYISGFSMLAFRPTKLVNALTGEEWLAQGKVRVSKDGDMTMQNIDVNDAVIRGSLMFHKVVVENTANGLALANQTTRIHTSLKGDIFVVARDYSVFAISFPPAYLFPGASVKIIVTKSIQYEMTITRLSDEESEYEDNWGEVYNGFVNILDSDRGVSSLQFYQSDYRMLELVSVKHPVHTNYYCWMLINAQE